MEILYTLETPSTGLSTEPFWERGSIFFEFNEQDKNTSIEIKFTRILSMRKRSEICCTAYHINKSYDRLVEIEKSAWASEILLDTSPAWRDKIKVHHYMIYLDSVGCFEVLAQGYKINKSESPTLHSSSANTSLQTSVNPPAA